MTTVAWVLLGVALACAVVVCVLGYALARACDDDWPLSPFEAGYPEDAELHDRDEIEHRRVIEALGVALPDWQPLGPKDGAR